MTKLSKEQLTELRFINDKLTYWQKESIRVAMAEMQQQQTMAQLSAEHDDSKRRHDQIAQLQTPPQQQPAIKAPQTTIDLSHVTLDDSHALPVQIGELNKSLINAEQLLKDVATTVLGPDSTSLPYVHRAISAACHPVRFLQSLARTLPTEQLLGQPPRMVLAAPQPDLSRVHQQFHPDIQQATDDTDEALRKNDHVAAQRHAGRRAILQTMAEHISHQPELESQARELLINDTVRVIRSPSFRDTLHNTLLINLEQCMQPAAPIINRELGGPGAYPYLWGDLQRALSIIPGPGAGRSRRAMEEEELDRLLRNLR